MKTFPVPFNPENHAPAAPGYRYLGKDEERKPTDETMTHRGGPWCPVVKCLWTISHIDQWTIRRALCVDDPYAPPPDQWSIPGWQVFEVQPGYIHEPDTQSWSPMGDGWQSIPSPGFPAVPGWYIRRKVAAHSVKSTIGIGWQVRYNTPGIKRLSPNQSIVIAVHDSQALSRAVQELALSAGFLWGDCDTKWSSIPVERCGGKTFIKLWTDGRKTLTFGPNALSHAGHCPMVLDARTDMGLFIDLLDSIKNSPKPVGPTINGYVSEYEKGHIIITFGCAEVCIHMLRHASKMFAYDVKHNNWMSNRTVAAITLDSGVKLTKTDIESILSYVDRVNAQS